MLYLFIHTMHMLALAGDASLGLLAAIGIMARTFVSNYTFDSRPRK